MFTSEKHNYWVSWLPLTQFSYNAKKQLSTEKSLFEVTRSYQPRMGFEQRATKAPAAEELTKQMEETLEQTKGNIEKARTRMKRQADRHRSQAPDYEISDKVWLSTENLKLTRASKKLTERWLGPYDITKHIRDNAIELRLPRSMKIHPVVNISRVKPYKERLEGQSTFTPGPVQVTEDREFKFEVESIIDSWWKGRRLEYLVHWKGYSEEDRTWEPKGNLANALEAIKDFHHSKPSTPRSLNMSQADFYFLFAYCGKPIPEIDQTRLPFNQLDIDWTLGCAKAKTHLLIQSRKRLSYPQSTLWIFGWALLPQHADTHNDFWLCPLLHACLIWSHLLWNHMLPRYAYHPLTLDKYPPFYIYDVTPTRHVVDHHLSHENRSLPKMDSLGKDQISSSHLWNRTHQTLDILEKEVGRGRTTEHDEPQANHIQSWSDTPGWDVELVNSDGDWNAEEWDVQQQNPTWLDTGMAVPDFIITALANIDHFRDEASGWLTLYIPAITITSESKETAPQIMEIPSENESELENPFLDNEPIPSFQLDWPLNDIGHMESDS